MQRVFGVKNSCVSANPADPVSNTRLCYFFISKKAKKKKKKKSKAPTRNKLPVFL